MTVDVLNDRSEPHESLVVITKNAMKEQDPHVEPGYIWLSNDRDMWVCFGKSFDPSGKTSAPVLYAQQKNFYTQSKNFKDHMEEVWWYNWDGPHEGSVWEWSRTR